MARALKNGGWLDNDHIYLTQELLRKQFPLIDGLQSSLLCQNDGFVPIQGEGMYKYSTIQLHITTLQHYVMTIIIIIDHLLYKVSKFIILVVTIGSHQWRIER